MLKIINMFTLSYYKEECIHYEKLGNRDNRKEDFLKIHTNSPIMQLKPAVNF